MAATPAVQRKAVTLVVVMAVAAIGLAALEIRLVLLRARVLAALAPGRPLPAASVYNAIAPTHALPFGRS